MLEEGFQAKIKRSDQREQPNWENREMVFHPFFGHSAKDADNPRHAQEPQCAGQHAGRDEYAKSDRHSAAHNGDDFIGERREPRAKDPQCAIGLNTPTEAFHALSLAQFFQHGLGKCFEK